MYILIYIFFFRKNGYDPFFLIFSKFNSKVSEKGGTWVSESSNRGWHPLYLKQSWMSSTFAIFYFKVPLFKKV